MFRIGLAMLAALVLASGQIPDPASATAAATPGDNSVPKSSGDAARPQGGSSRAGAMAYLTGRVLMEDGSVPPPTVWVRRTCGTRTMSEVHPDAQGYFNLPASGGATMITDASAVGGTPRQDPQSSSAPAMRGRGNAALAGASANDCEVLASLPGFRSEVLPLAGRRSMESPDIGIIYLHPQAASGDYTVSATTVGAPKKARRFYEKGLEAMRTQGPDAAQEDYLQAVHLYPRFAEAWYELGRIYEQRLHAAEARAAYTQAIAADRNFVKAHDGLSRLNIKELRWGDAIEESTKVLHLDPYHYPLEYYFNALANYQTNQFERAERSAREAVRLEDPEAIPEACYILGMVLAKRGELQEAAGNLRTYLAVSDGGASAENARRVLREIEAKTANR